MIVLTTFPAHFIIIIAPNHIANYKNFSWCHFLLAPWWKQAHQRILYKKNFKGTLVCGLQLALVPTIFVLHFGFQLKLPGNIIRIRMKPDNTGHVWTRTNNTTTISIVNLVFMWHVYMYLVFINYEKPCVNR